MTHQALALADQCIAIGNAMNNAQTFAEKMAEYAGKKKGAEHDEALKQAIAVIAKMEDFHLSQYQGKLAELLHINQRDLKRMVKTALTDTKTEDGENVEFTMGGYIGGFIVDMTYDPDDQQTMLAWRDPNGKIESGPRVTINNKKYAALPASNTILVNGVLFPSKLGPKKSTKELVVMIEWFIKRVYLLSNPLFAKIITYYILLTWVYDAYPAIPYLRATGEPGSGKSELMQRIGLLCYRRIIASGASSTASLFRMVEKYRGTVFLDEMDLQKSDASSDYVKFLVQGSMDGNPIFRCEEVQVDGKKEIQEIMFRTFCPKLIAMQGDFFDKAVGTRCITFQVQPRETYELVDAKVPLSQTMEMKAEALAIRNALLRWRLEMWQPSIEIDPAFYNLNITARLNQVTVPLMMLAKDDPDLQAEINTFMNEYHLYLVQDKAMTIEARIVEAMWKIYKYPDTNSAMVEKDPDGREKMKIGHVKDIANQIIAEMNMDEAGENDTKKKDVLSAQKVGHRIRERLQMEIANRTNKGFFVYWDERHMQALAKRYGVNPDELGPIVKKEAAVGASTFGKNTKPVEKSKSIQEPLPEVEDED
ncbi:MAG: hypothetical protein CVU43_04630 [Chloroflexi bacterium HGW-Chloroflexi-5]|jgi:hypothetical protein|nr:MAG: hypothetical protein CVU43_04630 [Chloroflexi bacterium HGW-Chloroflexi-5]